MHIATEADLGRVLKAARQRAGLSQEEMGAFLDGADRHIVADLENGRATTQLRRLLVALDVVGLELSVAPRTERLASDPSPD